MIIYQTFACGNTWFNPTLYLLYVFPEDVLVCVFILPVWEVPLKQKNREIQIEVTVTVRFKKYYFQIGCQKVLLVAQSAEAIIKTAVFQPNWMRLNVIAYSDCFVENGLIHEVCQHYQHSCPLQSEHQIHVTWTYWGDCSLEKNKYTSSLFFPWGFCIFSSCLIGSWITVASLKAFKMPHAHKAFYIISYDSGETLHSSKAV